MWNQLSLACYNDRRLKIGYQKTWRTQPPPPQMKKFSKIFFEKQWFRALNKMSVEVWRNRMTKPYRLLLKIFCPQNTNKNKKKHKPKKDGNFTRISKKFRRRVNWRCMAENETRYRNCSSSRPRVFGLFKKNYGNGKFKSVTPPFTQF